jgi:glycerol-3-phosphate dehydrogenase
MDDKHEPVATPVKGKVMPDTRQDHLAALDANTSFDVIVIGGGVNGIGVYRDLALQGLRVLLVERNDFASGCSAAPSRMIHGGLRYLENGEFDLVRESLRERDMLLRNAPHMVRPIPTLIPITSVFSGVLNGAASFFGWKGKPANRGAVPIKLGLSLYDWVTRARRALPRHHFNSGRATRAGWPQLMPAAKRSAVYYDAWISHPERLCIEMIKDVSAGASGSIALNYAEIGVQDGAHVVTCQRSSRQFAVTARALVNATGAWVDATARALGKPSNEQMVSGTKGSHLIIDNPALLAALNGHMVYFENADGRVCIVFPYLERVLAGSTDIRVAEAKQVGCDPSERDYILGSLRLVFPSVDVAAADVVFSYSGIRPLPKSDHDFTGRISRGHATRRLGGTPPQFCMVGGKWTTFRAFAEQTADEVLAELGQMRQCSTLELAIGGGRDFPAEPGQLARDLAQQYGIAPDRALHLEGHYGTQAHSVLAWCASRHDAPLWPGADYSSAEMDWLIAHEYVQTLADIVLRRTSLAVTGQISSEAVRAIAARLALAQGLTAQAVAEQIQSLTQTLSEFYGLSPDVLNSRNHEWRETCD